MEQVYFIDGANVIVASIAVLALGRFLNAKITVFEK